MIFIILYILNIKFMKWYFIFLKHNICFDIHEMQILIMKYFIHFLSTNLFPHECSMKFECYGVLELQYVMHKMGQTHTHGQQVSVCLGIKHFAITNAIGIATKHHDGDRRKPLRKYSKHARNYLRDRTLLFVRDICYTPIWGHQNVLENDYD